MNFELTDNLIQVTLLLIFGCISVYFTVKRHSRLSLMLAFVYSCFAMGTLYWVLHIAITGDTPKVFYVSELSWIASYFFLLSLQISRCQGIRIGFSPIATVCAAVCTIIAVYFQLMAPFIPLVLLFASSVGTIMYLSVYRAVKRTGNTSLDLCIAVIIVLQLALYIVSRYMSSFTEFNLYFAVDFALTASFCALLPLAVREDVRK